MKGQADLSYVGEGGLEFYKHFFFQDCINKIIFTVNAVAIGHDTSYERLDKLSNESRSTFLLLLNFCLYVHFVGGGSAFHL